MASGRRAVVARLRLGRVVLRIVRRILGCRWRRKVGVSLLCSCHVFVVTVFTVEVTAPVVSAALWAIPSSFALCATFSVFSFLIALVVSVVVGAIVCVVCLRTLVTAGTLGSLVVSAAIAIFLAVFGVVLLLWWAEITSWNLLEELVGNLLCTVRECFECEN